MAILSSLPGIQVTVCVGGQDAPEHDDNDMEPNPEPNLVSSYIEAETMMEFSIKLIVQDPFNLSYPTLGFQIYVDGVKVREPLLRRVIFEKANGYWESMWGGIKLSTGDDQENCVERPFKFSEIHTSTDDENLDALETDKSLMNKVGEIVVKLHRRHKSHFIGPKVEHDAPLDAPPSVVHEKALKGQAKSHGIALGQARASRFSRKFEANFMDGEGKPIAVFRFKYRDQKAFRSLLAIRRPAEPHDEPASRTASPEPVQQDIINIANFNPQEKRQIQDLCRMFQSGAVPRAPAVKEENPSARAALKRTRVEDATVEATVEATSHQTKKMKKKERPTKGRPTFIDLTDE
ncbi:hypothetical protein L207DRAFT_585338 [Hyaloscypha variabilis F]|uniref:DUF7918 domain-containing protein n=1 Tax=Hyaloscypha variabilis (strain UAMH 11265 / GT02V1 / F) TaxID=1149755 RepID=A0A2J6RIX1_HYAVF|nr:hypothetical protein L207DRAFT_585338 [Hyaloscypha variabilis F]